MNPHLTRLESPPERGKLLRIVLVSVALVSTVACQCPEFGDRLRVIPQVVCPNETVVIEAIFSHANRVDFSLLPQGGSETSVGAVAVDGDELIAIRQSTAVATTSTITATLSAEGCDPVQDSAVVSVIEGSEVIDLTFAPDCSAGRFLGWTPVDLAESRFSPSLVVRSITNVDSNARAITLLHTDSDRNLATGSALPGADFDAGVFAGRSLVGEWAIRANLRTFPREECENLGSVVPIPGGVPVPALTLRVVFGCPDP